MRRSLIGLVTALCLAVPGAAMAENLALLLGNTGQSFAMREPGGVDASDFRRTLSDAGFRVVEPPDRDIRSMRLAAVGVEAAVNNGQVDRLVVIATGPFANDGSDSWVLSNNTLGGSRLMIGAFGLSLNALTAMAAQRDIPAVIMVAPGVAPVGLAPGLKPGPGAFQKDDSVAYITGPSAALADLLAGPLLTEGVSFAEVAQSAASDIQVEGNRASDSGLMGPAAPLLSEEAIELGFWQAIQAFDTIAAYRIYLEDFPQGRFRKEARNRIAFLRDAPEREAKSGEEALGLSREDRRDIQRSLSLLGFDPRGIDGVFGPGSRAAIAAWQKQNRFAETGFVTGNQLLRLRDQARAEAERQEEEARKRREREERQDRSHWRDTGRGQDEAGLRAYLEKYPDGLYSDIARERLDEIEAAQRAEVEREEREVWDAARAADNEESYRAYLNTYPNGIFSDAAEARLRELRDAQQNEAVIAADRQQERQFTTTRVARILIEQRLSKLGTDPGQVDGKFTRKTRRAIRKFQRSRGLPVTGYVSQATMVRLMAGN